jgi:hypothetical protein
MHGHYNTPTLLVMKIGVYKFKLIWNDGTFGVQLGCGAPVHT